MKTPKEYNDNLKNNIITKNMLCDALYSVNKRAKNYREQEHKFSYGFFHDYKELNRNKKEEMYQYKTKLLSILTPTCLHKEFKGYNKIRIYDYEKEYKSIKEDDIVWENHYYDYDKQDYVEFVDILDYKDPIYLYYLFYDLKEHSFHTPIQENEIKMYKKKYHIDLIDIDELETYGHDVNDLISMQFVKKVLNLIEINNYKYIS